MDYHQFNRTAKHLSDRFGLSETRFDRNSQQKERLPHKEQRQEQSPLKNCAHSEEHAKSNHKKLIKSALSKRTNYLAPSSVLLSKFQRQFSLIEIINNQVYQIADRNEAYACNYPHFLILLGLTLQEIRLSIAPAPRIDSIVQYIIRKLEKPQLRQVVKESHYYDFMALMIKTGKKSLGRIHELILRVLTQQREVGVTVFPYYFNLFALVANKQAVFLKEDTDRIEYTVDYKHEKIYDSFTRQDVRRQWQEVEKRAIQRYNSEDL